MADATLYYIAFLVAIGAFCSPVLLLQLFMFGSLRVCPFVPKSGEEVHPPMGTAGISLHMLYVTPKFQYEVNIKKISVGSAKSSPDG